MPVFDYKCLDCGYIIEKRHSGDSFINAYCPECDKNNLKGERPFQKQLSAPIGFILKGQGFFKPSADRSS